MLRQLPTIEDNEVTPVNIKVIVISFASANQASSTFRVTFQHRNHSKNQAFSTAGVFSDLVAANWTIQRKNKLLMLQIRSRENRYDGCVLTYIPKPCKHTTAKST
jgi:hypothetical protein